MGCDIICKVNLHIITTMWAFEIRYYTYGFLRMWNCKNFPAVYCKS